MTGLLALAYLAFVSLGLPDAVIGVAWPSLRGELGLPQPALGLVLASSGSAYILSGLLAGRAVRTLGIGTLLAGSALLCAVGVVGYALAPVPALFLVAAALVGLGSGAVDAGLNAYAAHRFGARHMTWLHASYSVGAALGPAVMTAVLTRGASWRVGYAIISACLGILVVAFIAARRRWDAPSPSPSLPDDVRPTVTTRDALRRPAVWLQVATFAVYTGIEMTAGQWAFSVFTAARGAPTPVAGTWVTGYWASLLAGRIVLGFVVERIGTARLVRLGTWGGVVGGILFAFASGWPAVLGLWLLGFSLAPVFPGLMAETPRRLGADVATHAVGFQVSAATLGAALLPGLAGLVVERAGLAVVPPLVLAAAFLLLLLHELLLVVTSPAVRTPGSAETRTG